MYQELFFSPLEPKKQKKKKKKTPDLRLCRSTFTFVPSLSFLSGGALDPRFSLCSFLFHQHHVLPGSQFSPGCPGLLWLHLDQVLLGYMSYMSTSRFVHHYYKMDKIEQAAKNRKRQWQTATVVALHNFTCHLAFQSKAGGSSLIVQVLIGVF